MGPAAGFKQLSRIDLHKDFELVQNLGRTLPTGFATNYVTDF